DEVRPLFGEDRPPCVANRATPLETPTVGRWVGALEHYVWSAQVQRRVQVMCVPGSVECLNEGGWVVAHGWTVSGTGTVQQDLAAAPRPGLVARLVTSGPLAWMVGTELTNTLRQDG